MYYKSMIFFTLILLACNSRHYTLVVSANPKNFPDTVFISFEDMSSPKFEALKKRYRLDTIFHGEKDELKRILLLRHWIHQKIKIDDYGPYAGDGTVESTLDEALKGHGFHCGYFSAIQNAVLNAYGYVTRCVLVDTGTPVNYMVGGGHHAVNEVWINSYHKWFLSDAKYDYHFEKNGIPLSALEIRDEYLKNKAADINLVVGPYKTIVVGLPEYNVSTKEKLAGVYTWISWYKYNNRYSNNPNDSADIIMYNDSYFKTHTWLWDGKPHWAYHTRYLHLVEDRNAIEWTPNTITANIAINGDKASTELHSDTTNFKTYQIKEMPDGIWEDVSNNAVKKLKKDKYEWLFRLENIAGVTGPEYKVMIEKE